MGVTAPSTASIDEHSPLLAAQLSVNGGNTVTDRLSKNEHPSRFSVASEDDESVQERPLRSFFRVFYEFSTPFDHALRIIGVCAAIASGAALPCMTLVFGSFVDDFNSIGSGEQSSSEKYDNLSNNALLFLYLFVGRYVLVYIHSSCFGVSGIRANRALRQQFIKSVIRQDIAYIDSCSVGGITTTISASVI
ncbi:hypothetical protein N7520_000509 [Penicillium odoratum]|uniref:uncharacterized protein n=1 Tax=Penicillium odoratum TaxID=1167516 RepID=UPI002547FA0A|nr:uncharacterized protein N7520_000509 [Penicillium odoratum]KAJ5777263.1 hypothetical protein N7520_000509 [Penicillium odoratum]